MKTSHIAAVAIAGTALAVAGCGQSQQQVRGPTTAAVTQSPTAAACRQLAGGLAAMPPNEGPARDTAIRQITAAAAGTPIAGWVRDWRRVISVSPAAISRMTRAGAMDLVLKTAQVAGEIHGACLTAGVPGVMGN